MRDRLHFFDPTVINEALVRELAHPSCTMDDPLVAAQQAQFDAIAAARACGACTELQGAAPPPAVAVGLLEALRSLSKRERALLGAGAVAVLALVSAVSWIWPWGFGK